MLRSRIQLVSVGALATALLSGLAVANQPKTGLEFCNRSNRGTAYVALAYPGTKGWTSQGWLTLKPGQCDRMVEGKLTNRYYYYYADTDGDYRWQGTQPFCISSQQFTFVQADKQCRGSSSFRKRFRELDTGRDATGYTLELR